MDAVGRHPEFVTPVSRHAVQTLANAFRNQEQVRRIRPTETINLIGDKDLSLQVVPNLYGEGNRITTNSILLEEDMDPSQLLYALGASSKEDATITFKYPASDSSGTRAIVCRPHQAGQFLLAALAGIGLEQEENITFLADIVLTMNKKSSKPLSEETSGLKTIVAFALDQEFSKGIGKDLSDKVLLLVLKGLLRLKKSLENYRS